MAQVPIVGDPTPFDKKCNLNFFEHFLKNDDDEFGQNGLNVHFVRVKNKISRFAISRLNIGYKQHKAMAAMHRHKQEGNQ